MTDVINRQLKLFKSQRKRTKEEGKSSEWLGNRKQVGSFASTNNQALEVHVRGGSKYDHMLVIWARLLSGMPAIQQYASVGSLLAVQGPRLQQELI